jgi:Na+/H+ antiporter NhaD/arsenite permease-like protein
MWRHDTQFSVINETIVVCFIHTALNILVVSLVNSVATFGIFLWYYRILSILNREGNMKKRKSAQETQMLQNYTSFVPK